MYSIINKKEALRENKMSERNRKYQRTVRENDIYIRP